MVKNLVHDQFNISLGIAFCISGLIILGFVSYYDYMDDKTSDSEKMESIQDVEIGKSRTLNVLYQSTAGSHQSLYPFFPSNILVKDYSVESKADFRNIIEISWIPLLIAGSYLLIHTDYQFLHVERK